VKIKRTKFHHTSFLVNNDRGTICVVPDIQANAADKASTALRVLRIFSAASRK
jgi:hypothetical protein